ncbi:CarD family transcriptional regulator [Bariatricus sp. SGI.154]|uniref:CarD family transcriptional regulator n=1 Tax=Bariatricus sp. SGI.154 TaxID=3420549 RepID=UPI003D044668
MFKIGDYVAHYKEGVCEVTSIGKLNMSCSDKKKDYYTLKPLYDAGGTLYTPVDNEKKQIREVISNEEAQMLIADMSNIETIWVPDEKRREMLYKEALMKNQCREWIAIIKTSYLRKMKRMASGKKAINVDDKYLNIAERFLYGELAVALDMPKDEVKGYITKRMKA